VAGPSPSVLLPLVKEMQKGRVEIKKFWKKFSIALFVVIW
jgi:hypothetical protein